MPNRQLSEEELKSVFAPLIASVRADLQRLSKGDSALLFALRRKLFKELSYDERGKPTHRKILKARKFGEQKGLCAICNELLPDSGRYAVIDRFVAAVGYTPENTQLICSACDVKAQAAKGYS